MAIKSVGVIGCGLMGSGIVQVAAQAGFRTVVVEANQTLLARGLGGLGRTLDGLIAKAKLDAAGKQQILDRITGATDFSAFKDCDLVIEAITENQALKNETFAKLDAVCPPHALLASNTSSCNVTAMAAATKRPDKVLGMHFFNPVPKMKLVEIVRALDTTDGTIATTTEVARRMGKETVVVKESPGFITSRVNAMIGNEAFLILEQGIATAEDIDKALKLGLNHPMGPFEMVDLVGLDTRLAVLQFLQASLGEKYRPADLMVRYVKEGRLGRKVGRGVYDYGGKE
jgi:3-hydroxybutyryl-CoA dehydrogenase